MIEKDEIDYRKLIEIEIENLNIQGETKKRLLAETNEILKLAFESEDKFEFLSTMAGGDPRPTPYSDFKYEHVIAFLNKRGHISRKSAVEDFRSMIKEGMSKSPESFIKTSGRLIAIKASALSGTTDFKVNDVVVGAAANSKQTDSWAEGQIGSGSNLVFIQSNEGWKLLAADSGFEFSEKQINSFFSQDLLTSLWLTHKPLLIKQGHDFRELKSKGLN